MVLAFLNGTFTLGFSFSWMAIYLAELFTSPVRGNRLYGGHAIEARDPSPLFGIRPRGGARSVHEPLGAYTKGAAEICLDLGFP